MSYEEFVASIQEAVAEKVSAGNILFGVVLLIAIITGLVFFFLYVRKEYYRKRSEIDNFMLEDQHKTDIFVPGLSDRPDMKKHKESFFEKLYKKINKDD